MSCYYAAFYTQLIICDVRKISKILPFKVWKKALCLQVFHWWLKYLTLFEMTIFQTYLRLSTVQCNQAPHWSAMIYVGCSHVPVFPSFFRATFWRKLIPSKGTEGTVSKIIAILLCFFVITSSHTSYWLPVSVTAVIPEAWSRWFRIIGISSLLVWQRGLYLQRYHFVFLGFKLSIFVLDKMSLCLVICSNSFHSIYFWFLADIH